MQGVIAGARHRSNTLGSIEDTFVVSGLVSPIVSTGTAYGCLACLGLVLGLCDTTKTLVGT